MLGATANPSPTDGISGDYNGPERRKEVVANSNIMDSGKAVDWNKENRKNSEKY